MAWVRSPDRKEHAIWAAAAPRNAAMRRDEVVHDRFEPPAPSPLLSRAIRSGTEPPADASRWLPPLQRSLGNRFVQRLLEQEAFAGVILGSGGGTAGPFEVTVNGDCGGLDLQGQTHAAYSPSYTYTVAYRPTAGGVIATGTLTCTYRVATTVTLPDVPDGLTGCEARLVRHAIDTTLRRHEARHVAAFNTYRGVTRRPFRIVLQDMQVSDGKPALDAALEPHLEAMFNAEEAPRRSRADAASAALDPFNLVVDCSACPDE